MEYLIWSEEHGAWWMPHASGYTRSVLQAGRYSADQAQTIVGQANLYLGPLESVNEIAFAVPESLK